MHTTGHTLETTGLLNKNQSTNLSFDTWTRGATLFVALFFQRKFLNKFVEISPFLHETFVISHFGYPAVFQHDYPVSFRQVLDVVGYQNSRLLQIICWLQVILNYICSGCCNEIYDFNLNFLLFCVLIYRLQQL